MTFINTNVFISQRHAEAYYACGNQADPKGVQEKIDSDEIRVCSMSPMDAAVPQYDGEEIISAHIVDGCRWAVEVKDT